jgi:F-type H+-transporting ATPase subunit gamma
MLRQSLMRARKPLQNMQQRTMVTETQLRARINTVTNVRKITSTMKMVAASKLRKSENVLTVARALQRDIVAVWPDAEVADESLEKEAIVTICSDGGLCGAVNSAIVKMVKTDATPWVKEQKPVEMVLLGTKALQGLERQFKGQFKTTITDAGKLKVLTFRQAVELTQQVLAANYDRASLYYNKFRSAVSYDTEKVNFYKLDMAIGEGKFLLPYDVEGDQDTIENFYQFRTAVRMFHFISENDTSTLSSRMNAMENSSKNAGEMLDALSLQLNRSRQARITTELIEIISGAAAAEEMGG